MMFLINTWVALIALGVAYVVYKYVLPALRERATAWVLTPLSHPSHPPTARYVERSISKQADQADDEGADKAKVDYRAGLRFAKVRSSILSLKEGDLDFK